MEEDLKKLLDAAASALNMVKLALYAAENLAPEETKDELNQLWWAVDGLHRRLTEYLCNNS